jgi:hypothetical protein
VAEDLEGDQRATEEVVLVEVAPEVAATPAVPLTR